MVKAGDGTELVRPREDFVERAPATFTGCGGRPVIHLIRFARRAAPRTCLARRRGAVVMMIMTFFDVVLRSTVNTPIEAATELTRILMAIVVFSALPVVSGGLNTSRSMYSNRSSPVPRAAGVMPPSTFCPVGCCGGQPSE